MHHTYEIEDLKKTFDLGNNTIDNRNGNFKICLKSVIFWIGYHNIPKRRKIKYGLGGSPSEFTVYAGLYSVDQLIGMITNEISWVSMEVNKYNARLKLVVPENKVIKFPEEIAGLFSLDATWLTAGTYDGNVDMQPFKAIYLHCDQISSTNNIFNGEPTNLLDIIPLGNEPYESSVHIECYDNGIEKSLVCGIINEFRFRIKDVY